MTRALHAEWTKARTVASTGWLLAAVAALTVALGAAAAAAVHCPAAGCSQDPARTALAGVQASQAVVAVLAVLLAGAEYSTGMIRLSLAAVPRRGSLLAAKAGVLAGLILVAGTVAVAGSLLAARLLLPGTLPLAGPGTARAAAGSVLYLALVALLSLGAAAAIREPAAAIGAVLGLLYLFPLAAAVVTDPSWQRHLRQAGPMTAGLAVQATTGLRGLPVGPWAGLGVLAGWAAVLLAAGAAALRWRDA